LSIFQATYIHTKMILVDKIKAINLYYGYYNQPPLSLFLTKCGFANLELINSGIWKFETQNVPSNFLGGFIIKPNFWLN